MLSNRIYFLGESWAHSQYSHGSCFDLGVPCISDQMGVDAKLQLLYFLLYLQHLLLGIGLDNYFGGSC